MKDNTTRYLGGNVTLRFWHGGKFVNASTGELIYLGGEGKTHKFDPDELCYFDIMKYAKECGNYASVEGVYYLIPSMGLAEGLNKRCVQGCPFYLFASWHSLQASFIVKVVVSEHKCHRNMKKNRQFTSTWVAKEMLEVFKARPHWPGQEIVDTIKRAYKVIVKKSFAYKVKYKAHQLLHGSMADHYNKLGRYIAAIKAANPNTITDLVVVPKTNSSTPVFQRFFMCFEGLQSGWKDGCRNVICVDAAFLKTFLGGQILCAVGRDANEQMFPIAWAIVEWENLKSWEWFFKHIQSCLNLGDGQGYAVISDEHQGILSVVASVLPLAEHRHCARHVFAHWHNHFRGDEIKERFWQIARAYNLSDYNEAMAELEKLSPAAATAFNVYNPKCFCRAYMSLAIKSDAITNNMTETFNVYVVNARTKHLINMVEDIRVALMQRMVAKRKHNKNPLN